MDIEEIQQKIAQAEISTAKDSLIVGSRQLGRIEGMLEMMDFPDKRLILVRDELSRLHDHLQKKAQIEPVPESKSMGIGSEQ